MPIFSLSYYAISGSAQNAYKISIKTWPLTLGRNVLRRLQLHRIGYQIRAYHGINLLNSGQFKQCPKMVHRFKNRKCSSSHAFQKGATVLNTIEKYDYICSLYTYAYDIKCIYKIRLLFFPSLSGMSVLWFTRYCV